MKRRAFNFAVVVSLVVMVAIGVVWWAMPWKLDRGYQPYDRPVEAEPKSEARFVATEGGSVRFMRQRVTCDPAGGALCGDAGVQGFILLRDGREQVGVISRLKLEPANWRAGFGWGRYSMFSPNPSGGQFRFEYSVVAIPYWPVLALAAIAPAVWLRGWWVRRGRRKRGECLACGYDLRGLPVGGKCPECGAVGMKGA